MNTLSLYPSNKILPYVYMGIHKTTKQFYIGYRENKNRKLPSHLDLQKYRTSSTTVKPMFDEFDWFIIAEFFDGVDAYEFEQLYIQENIKNPLIINKIYYTSGKQFRVQFHSEETKSKISKAQLGIPKSEEAKRNMSIAHKERNIPISDETRKKISDASKSRTQHTKSLLSKANLGKVWIANLNTKIRKRVLVSELPLYLNDSSWIRLSNRLPIPSSQH